MLSATASTMKILQAANWIEACVVNDEIQSSIELIFVLFTGRLLTVWTVL